MAGIKVDVEKLVDGILDELTLGVRALPSPVSLGITSTTDDYASSVYMKKKLAVGERVGVKAEIIKLSGTIEDVKNGIKKASKEHTAIINQLPLADEYKEHQDDLFKIAVNDADGLYHLNKAYLYDGEGLLPCTARGVLYLMEELGKVDIRGAEVLIIGRSNLVGKPLAMRLIAMGASVTIVGSTVKNLKHHLKNKDYIITAVGQDSLFDSNDISNGTFVIDVGITRDANNKLTGDMKHIEDSDVEYMYTPVPKGVGLLTTAFLYANVFAIEVSK